LNNHVFSQTEEDLVFIWTNTYDDDERACQMDLTWFVKKQNGDYRRYDETHFQFTFSTSEIKKLMQQAGFQKINCYDNFTLHKAHEQSERVFYAGIAR
jgi:hypothetical protein